MVDLPSEYLSITNKNSKNIILTIKINEQFQKILINNNANILELKYQIFKKYLIPYKCQNIKDNKDKEYSDNEIINLNKDYIVLTKIYYLNFDNILIDYINFINCNLFNWGNAIIQNNNSLYYYFQQFFCLRYFKYLLENKIYNIKYVCIDPEFLNIKTFGFINKYFSKLKFIRKFTLIQHSNNTFYKIGNHYDINVVIYRGYIDFKLLFNEYNNCEPEPEYILYELEENIGLLNTIEIEIHFINYRIIDINKFYNKYKYYYFLISNLVKKSIGFSDIISNMY